MRKFKITVNGTEYDVDVEEITGESASVKTENAAAPVKPVPAAKPAVKTAVGGVEVKAPMPGSIIKLNAAAGQSVKRGDVLCVLEAMKMENDICAPADGTVVSVSVAKGASVKADDVLVTLK